MSRCSSLKGPAAAFSRQDRVGGRISAAETGLRTEAI